MAGAPVLREHKAAQSIECCARVESNHMTKQLLIYQSAVPSVGRPASQMFFAPARTMHSAAEIRRVAVEFIWAVTDYAIVFAPVADEDP